MVQQLLWIGTGGSGNCTAIAVGLTRWVNKWCSNCCGLGQVGQGIVEQLLGVRPGGSVDGAAGAVDGSAYPAAIAVNGSTYFAAIAVGASRYVAAIAVGGSMDFTAIAVNQKRWVITCCSNCYR